MKLTELSSRYSRSIFELAEERNVSSHLVSELKAVKNAMGSRPELVHLLQSPLMSRNEKASLIKGILGAGSSPLTGQFLNLLVAKGRVDLFPQIVDQLQSMLQKKEGIQEVNVVGARPFHANLIQLLERALHKLTGKTIRIQSTVNPSLLGGIQIRMENRLIDGSVRAKLNALEMQLRG